MKDGSFRGTSQQRRNKPGTNTIITISLFGCLSGSRSAPFSLYSEAKCAARRCCAEVNKIPAVTPGCAVTSPAPLPLVSATLSCQPRIAVQRGGFSLFSSGVVVIRCIPISLLFAADPCVSIRVFPSNPFAHVNLHFIFSRQTPRIIITITIFFYPV